MPASTDLSVSPYFNDFSPANHYNQVLFRPSVSVQVRELNELQSILQNQIERFGDNIYKSGTIIEGCNFSFDPAYSYCKLSDASIEGLQIVPENFVGMYATNQNGVQAYIKNFANGYVSTDPKLNTIYVDYIASGYDLQSTFASGDSVRISDANNVIFSIKIESPGATYSNNDTLIFTSALAVNVSSGSNFTNGEILYCASSNSRAQIIEVNTSIYTDQTVLKLKPRLTDISNTALGNVTPWIFNSNSAVIGQTSSAAGTIVDVFGKNATGIIITDGAGRIVQTNILNQGTDYRIAPYVTVKPALLGSATATGLSLTARNYYVDVQVPAVANVTGMGYAMSVSAGVIYQKGYFIDVEPQTIIVSNYTNTPNNVSVIFQTHENIITSDIDPDLLDNTLGEPNATAPGADRLQLIAALSVIDSDEAENATDFLTLAAFSEGTPYKQNQYTQFNSISKELAQRTSDSDGDFVIDKFYATTRSPLNSNYEANSLSIVVDPGVAYVSGYRIKTSSNFAQDVPKGVALANTTGSIVSLDYDQYIRINEVGGVFQFQIGDLLRIYSAKKQFLSNTSLTFTNNLTPTGFLVATARMRSLVFESGTPGTPSAVYRLYVFNTKVVAGKSIQNAKSVYYLGTDASKRGIGDILLDAKGNVLSGNNEALLFDAQVPAVQQVKNASYTYRTIDQTLTIANNGTATISVSVNPNETFPYTGNLTSIQMTDFYVAPLTALTATTALTGTIATNTTSSLIVGTGTSFSSQLAPGDYVYLYGNSTVTDIRRVVSIGSDTQATLDSNGSIVYTGAQVYRYFPPSVPVPFGTRSGLTANVTANSSQAVLNFGMTFNTPTTSNAAIAYNVRRSGVNSGTKIADRNNYVRIDIATNDGGTTGPWCLGAPDIIRLTNVFFANSTGGIIPGDITDSFYIDHNQNVDYLGLGYLYKDPKSSLTINNGTYLLVRFDAAVVSTPGFFTTDSYVSANVTQVQSVDSASLYAAGNNIISYEIPELYSNKGNYYDLMNYIDFRPSVTATANLNATTVNPSATESFNTSSDFKFPLPGSTMTADISYYMGRIDSVVVDKNGYIDVVSGIPSEHPVVPKTPNECLLVDQFAIPPYPGIPANPSTSLVNQISTRMASEQYNTTRINNRIIKSVMQANNKIQPKNYTKSDIGELERRIQALEYTVSLNEIETKIVNQNIPSSISANNRSIYGFFADDFTTDNFVDKANPEFAATTYNSVGRLFPSSEQVNLRHGSGMSFFPSFNEFTIASQGVASYIPSIVNATSNTTTSNTTIIRYKPIPCIVANTGLTYQQTVSQYKEGAGWFAWDINMSDYSGNATLYIKTSQGLYPDAYFVGTPELHSFSVDVYQSEVTDRTKGVKLMDSSSASYIGWWDLYAENVNAYKSYNIWITTVASISDGRYVNYNPKVIKLPIKHDATKGKYYRFVVKENGGTFNYQFVLDYPINSNKVADCINKDGGKTIKIIRTVKTTTTTYTIGDSTVTIGGNTAYPSNTLMLFDSTNPAFVATNSSVYTLSTPLIDLTNPFGLSSTYANTATTINTDVTTMTGYINQYLSTVGVANNVSKDIVYLLSRSYEIATKRPADLKGLIYFSKSVAQGTSALTAITQIQNTQEGAYVILHNAPMYVNTIPYQTTSGLTLVATATSQTYQNTSPNIAGTNMANTTSRGVVSPKSTSSISTNMKS